MPQETSSAAKVSIAKANRKIAKPIMEKKRRARINASLNELKTLLVEVLQKEGCRHSSKMEKADILEMAVRHLKNLHKQQSYPGAQCPTLRDSYPPAIPIEKYASSLPPESLTPEMKYLANKSLDHPVRPRVSEGAEAFTAAAAKLDSNRTILPAPQPMNINFASLNSQSQTTHTDSVVSQTNNGEIRLMLPHHILSGVNGTSAGVILPVYALPKSDQSVSNPTSPCSTSSQQHVLLRINTPLQQSPNSAFSQTSASTPSPSKAPLSPVWRPW